MTELLEIDEAAAGRLFVDDGFNETWTLLEKTDQTTVKDQIKIAASLTSVYHWLKRPDCDDRQRSIGYWQVSRLCAVLGQAAEALYYADLCCHYSRKLIPFYRGYAYEALARGAALAGNLPAVQTALAEAKGLLTQITDATESSMLTRDLSNLEATIGS